MNRRLRLRLSTSGPAPWRAWAGSGLLAVGLAACGEAPKQAEQPPLPVLAETVAIGPAFSSVALTGEIRARVQSDLSFRSSGRIASRTVEIGDRVAAGQILATLETTEQNADVASARAGVQSAEATVRQAAAAFDRQKALMASGFTTQASFDNASQALTAAQASLVSARSTLATAEEQLGYAALRADAAGVITARNAEAGQVVEAAQAIFTLARDGARDAVFDLYETILTQRPAEDTVSVTLLANPAVRASGKVREVAPTIDPSTGTVRVKVDIESPPAGMGLGAAVSGVGRFRSQDVAALPWTAFFTQGDKPAVWVVDPQTKSVALRPVTVASYRSGETLVRDGLKAGEIVVTAGVQLLRPGQIVALQPPANQTGAPK